MSSSRLRDRFAGASLRARLLAALLLLLALVCLIISGVTELAANAVLVGQIDGQLRDASHRAADFTGLPAAAGSTGGAPTAANPSGANQPGGDANDATGGTTAGPGGSNPGGHGGHPGSPDGDHGRAPDPNSAPGMGAGTINARIAGGAVLFAGRVPNSGVTTEQLSAAQQQALSSLPVDGQVYTRDLAGLGQYRLTAATSQDGDIVITGLPLHAVDETLTTLGLVLLGVSLSGMLVAGAAGAVIVRRTLEPLRRVAGAAGRVAELPLDRGEVALSVRVPDADTDPRTEVGQVGAALNRMLGHIGNALAARHASETRVRQFVADASHELRTPLAAIRGYAELARRNREPVPADVAHALGRVESESARMTTLVEDLLLLARLDSGRPLDREPVDLTQLVVDTTSDARIAGPDHHWRLDLPVEPVEVPGDLHRLHQVLANLLSNARTHTPAGRTVTVALGETDRHATVTVTDDGPGIPPELQPEVFERFARGDNARSRAAGSTGLGLAIVSAVVAAHHGSVDLRSEPGRTAITVRLPRD